MVKKAKEIKELLNRRPFIPLRIHLSDGTAYDIHHPELLHVVRVEDLEPV